MKFSTKAFSSEKFIRCSPFLLDEFCKLNLLFSFFTFLSIHVSSDDENILFRDTTDNGR